MNISSNSVRGLLECCNGLIANRSRYTNKEEYARAVLHAIFGDRSLDLLYITPYFDTLHADALQRLNILIGFESTVFMTIYVNDALFDEFINLFSRHCFRSIANIKEATESMYLWLLTEYLQYLLPIDENKLNLLKNSNWLSGPLSSLPTSAVTSPRRLLRPEVLAQSAPLEHISLRSGAFKTLYPRLLQFVGTLLNNLTSLSNWPSIAQFQVLLAILKHYNEFILVETDDSEFSSLKLLLLRKPFFVEMLQNFLEKLLRNWPFDESYCQLVEIWRALIYQKALERCSDEKYRLFVQASSQYFAPLIEVKIRRMLDTGNVQLLESPVLNFVKDNVFRYGPVVEILLQQRLPVVDYLRALCFKLTEFRSDIQKNVKKVRSQRDQSPWTWLYNWIFKLTYNPPVDMCLLDAQIRDLQELITKLSGKPQGMKDSDFQSSFMNTSRDQSQTLGQSILNPKIPDHSVDPWTKMLYLTPHGRLQVISREAKFDYSKYSKQISDAFPSIGYWDVAPLAIFLHRLSIRWNNSWLVRYLRQHAHESIVGKYTSKVLLSGPSPPRYVPVFSRFVPQLPARLNLRLLANTPLMIYTLFCFLFVAIFFKVFF